MSTETTWPATVAMAAPAMPISKTKMKMGSKIVLTMAPESIHIMEYLGLPSARARLLRPLMMTSSGIPSATMRVYSTA